MKHQLRDLFSFSDVCRCEGSTNLEIVWIEMSGRPCTECCTAIYKEKSCIM